MSGLTNTHCSPSGNHDQTAETGCRSGFGTRDSGTYTCSQPRVPDPEQDVMFEMDTKEPVPDLPDVSSLRPRVPDVLKSPTNCAL